MTCDVLVRCKPRKRLDARGRGVEIQAMLEHRIGNSSDADTAFNGRYFGWGSFAVLVMSGRSGERVQTWSDLHAMVRLAGTVVKVRNLTQSKLATWQGCHHSIPPT